MKVKDYEWALVNVLTLQKRGDEGSCYAARAQQYGVIKVVLPLWDPTQYNCRHGC